MSGEGIGSLVNKVVDLLFGVAKKEISYMWYYTENIDKFNKEVEKLKVRRGEVQQQIDISDRIGDNLKHGVKEWVNDAGDEISKAEEFLEQEKNAKKTCFNIGMCGNWSTLHRYGKGATKMVASILELQERGSSYENGVSVYTPALGELDVYQNKDLEGIDTHNLALNATITALEDDSIQIVGIYGLGGVGKTTLAKEVVARVKNKLFADVAFTAVSQNKDVEKIKRDTGEAAKRIVKGDKILIILDDVWETLDLEELCIPCGSNYKNCKILLTSRSQAVCQKMNAQRKVCVNSLPIKEAWILFKSVVGEKVETDANLKQVAVKVAEECGGLPLLIKAVGNTLKEKDINSWQLALTQLKRQAPAEIDRDIEKAFTHLKLSYEYLTSEEAKSCFLLCSMFPEDADIYLEDLVYYGVGLGKFVDLDSIEDARDRVLNAVNILTSSSLLLDTFEDYRGRCTKMHDVVRDVALLIASRDNNKFLVKAGKGLNEWLPESNSLESYRGISLMNNKISKLPDYEVHLPNLQIFTLRENSELPIISDEFIGGMKEVKVLDMQDCENAHLPQSLKLLTKLRMLNLREIKSFHESSILGKMKDLEILILEGTGIKEIPKEIGQLVKLRRLEVIRCPHLSHITPGVISKLQRLEELCIDFRWVHQGIYNCIVEIMELPKLTYLKLIVESFDAIPDGFSSEKLKSFYIGVGKQESKSTWERELVINKDKLEIPLLKWLMNLIEVSRPRIVLFGVKNLHNIMPDLYQKGFNKLENLLLLNCCNVSCLVDSTMCDWDQGKTSEKVFMQLKHLQLWRLNKMEVLWKCPDEYISLTNLVILEIFHCVKLERVFTLSLAQGLVNLKELNIYVCNSLQEVVWGSGGDDHSSNIIVFPSLVSINLNGSSKLKSFYSGNGNCTIKYPSLVKVGLWQCESMQIWGPGIHETYNLKEMIANCDVIVLDGPFAINEAVVKSVDILKKKKEEGHD